MPATVRGIRKGEELAFVRSVRIPFLEAPNGTPEDEAGDRRRAARLELDRTWVAEDGGRFVANCVVRTMDLTVPASPGNACPIVRMGGVSAVGVHPTHRRRGLLTAMMETMLEDCRSRGEPFAGLIASESVIYGRFGFGHATDNSEYEVDSLRSGFGGPVRDIGLHLLEKDEARKVLPDVWERTRRGRAGEPNRTPEFWDQYFEDESATHNREGSLFFVACDDGYASYRPSPEDDVLRGVRVPVTVEELWGADPEVEASLWRFVLDLDLVGSITFRRRPVDDPIRWRLRDPRQLRTKHVDDRLYIRVLDVAATLEQRGYRSAGRLVIDLKQADVSAGRDPAVGTWVLEAGPDGATCAAARGARADLRMRVTDLGSLYLGGFKASTLAAAGLVEELTPGSLDVADRLFASGPAPATVTGF